MKKSILLVPILLSLAFFSACNDDVICTDLFSMAGIRIHGLQPTSHYTVRQSTGDTLYRNLKLDDSLYLMLDDKYLPELTESSDIFTFHGFLDDSLIAEEEFLITADKCHIRVVSGKFTIEIEK
jgi:hypothetical protein